MPRALAWRIALLTLEFMLGAVLLILIILSLLGYITLAVVEGNSMEPALQTGDVVIVIKRISIRDISVGDVVVYRRGGALIIHRVVAVSDGILITKGDNNPLVDPPVSFENVIGKVLEIGNNVFKIPLIGYLTLLVRYSTSSLT